MMPAPEDALVLDELHVRDIALIEDASIAFSPHLTVLTGETGAGKTALLTALRLICGQRADRDAVRDGCDEAAAEARFVGEGAEHVVRRRLSSAGRSRCAIDGSMATVSELAQATGFVRVHSQHEQVLLLQPSAQLAYLDSWVDPDGGHLACYRDAWQEHAEAQKALEALEAESAEAAQQLEFMRFTAEQIDAVDPQEGEYEHLEGDLPRLQHAEQLAQAVDGAVDVLQRDGGSLDQVAEAVDALQRQSGIDAELDALAQRLSGLQVELDDLARDLGSYAGGVTSDPQRLEQTLARLDELSGLMKRYGPTMERVFQTRERARQATSRAESSPERLQAARARCDEALRRLRGAAADLARVRAEAAVRLCDELGDAVHELAMEDASFEFSFTDLPFGRWGLTGSQRVELLYRPSATSSPRPLSRIASGGELSRILLSLELVFRRGRSGDAARTIVFDEVDQGVGGATGEAVARCLAQLAQSAQVIVVTHLPQVAARADRHYVVVKGKDADGGVTTDVTEVVGEERVAEIARMLAGHLDEAALEHARSLLADAAGEGR